MGFKGKGWRNTEDRHPDLKGLFWLQQSVERQDLPAATVFVCSLCRREVTALLMTEQVTADGGVGSCYAMPLLVLHLPCAVNPTTKSDQLCADLREKGRRFSLFCRDFVSSP